MLTVHDHPRVRKADVPVDVFANGTSKVAEKDKPSPAALFQLMCPALFFNCQPDYMPAAGEKLPAYYLNNKPQHTLGGSFEADGKTLFIKCDLGDHPPEEGPESQTFKLALDRGGFLSGMKTVGWGYFMQDQVLIELKQRGYQLLWTKVA